jgi:hypothetical protein
MCVTAIIAGVSLLASAVGTYASIQSNNANKANAKFQADLRTKELVESTELAKIAAMQRENDRARTFSRAFSSSMAAIGASGAAEHISFFQGIGPDSDQQFLQDSRAIRLNLATERIANEREIGVVGFGSKIAGFNASMGNVGAIAGFMQDAMGAASLYAKTRVPAGGN